MARNSTTGQQSSEPTVPAKTSRPSRAKPKTQVVVVDDDDTGPEVEEVSTPTATCKGKRQQVNWIKNPSWTDKIVGFLRDDPTFRIKLFSDSTADEKRDQCGKTVAKEGKAILCGTLAKHIFANDPQEQARYANDPTKYALAVETRLRRLKKDYIKLLGEIGATGAGLAPDQVKAGAQLASIFEEVRKKWRWWDDFHAFWRELPNYNPVGVQSSEPGVDHAGAAADLFETATTNTQDEEDELEEDEEEQDDDVRSETSKAWGTIDDEGDHEYRVSEDEDAVKDSSPLQVPRKRKVDSVSEDGEKEHEYAQSPSPTSSPSPPPPPKKSKKAQAKVPANLTGRDLGLAKANAAKSSAPVKRKPQTHLDRMNDLREKESDRLAEKRKLQHREEMERLNLKRLKYKVKLAQAANETARLNRHPMSQSTLRSPTRHNTYKVLNISTSPSKSRSARPTPSPARPSAAFRTTTFDNYSSPSQYFPAFDARTPGFESRSPLSYDPAALELMGSLMAGGASSSSSIDWLLMVEAESSQATCSTDGQS
ncbi:hypothetical protein C8R45DRAFT_1109233 [Mycena sanguinolenta]|nr:hypothetical protein C8R45DRAFT_1109233 [Mycena sanguinolenta]